MFFVMNINDLIMKIQKLRKKEFQWKLQYAYSIVVFVAVFFTAYLMISQENGSNLFTRDIPTQDARYRNYAGDPAIEQLILVEKALSKIQASKIEKPNRMLSVNPELKE